MCFKFLYFSQKAKHNKNKQLYVWRKHQSFLDINISPQPFALLCSSDHLGLFDQWFVKAKVQKQAFLALPKHKKTKKIPPFMLLQDGLHRLKQRHNWGCHQPPRHFPWSFSLNSPYHSHREQRFVCQEVWGFSSIWAYFTDSSLISGKTSFWQMNLPAVPGAQDSFQRLIW